MRSLELLRTRLRELGPEAEALLSTLGEVEAELELRAQRIAALTSAEHITTTLATGATPDARVVGGNLLMAARALIDNDGAALALLEPPLEADRVAERDDEAPAASRLRLVACEPCEAPVADEVRDGCALAVRARAAMYRALTRGAVDTHPGLRPAGSGVMVADFRSSFALRLDLRGVAIGALYLERRGPRDGFPAADRETLRLFARQAALAVALTVVPNRAEPEGVPVGASR